MKKKILGVMLVLAMLLLMPMIASAATRIDSEGICGANGDNLTWTFDYETETLTISGEGDMKDYSANDLGTSDSPFYDAYEINYIIIDNGVTSIGNNAFRKSGLRSIIIPDSVTSIGSRAFFNCSALESITIPDSVINIGYCAFQHCYELNSITILNNMTSIKSGAFDYTEYYNNENNWENGALYIGKYLIASNSALSENYVIKEGTTSIAGAAFDDCDKLKSVTIPDSVINIVGGAFRLCYNLETVYYNAQNCIHAGAYNDTVFRGCDSLKEIYIGDHVETIPSYLFCYCKELTSITIPDSIVRIGSSAFDNTGYYNNIDNWENGALYIGKYLIASNSKLSENYVIKEGTSFIADSAFNGCTGITSITIPNSVTSIGSDAFSGCNSLERVYVPELAVYLNIDFANSTSNPMYYANKLYVDNKRVTSLVIPEGVTKISAYAFHGCDSLSSITIPGSVTSIGEYAFPGCDSLSSITIPDSVTSISAYAFSGCSSLENIKIGSGITNIGKDAFSGCSSLKDVYISDVAAWCGIDFSNVYSNPLYYANNFYLNDELVTDLIIPDSVTTIDDYAFRNCSRLASVTIGTGVTSIGENIFLGCNSLKKLSYNAENLGLINFAEIPSLREVHIGENVSVMPESTFSGCSNLEKVTIENGIISFGSSAFSGCNKLKDITIPGSVTSIGADAFKNCNNLINVYIPDIANWCDIDFGNIYSNPLYYANNLYIDGKLTRDIIIPDSVTDIGNYAFQHFGGFASIVFGKGVTSINNSAFIDCPKLISVTIPANVTSITGSEFTGCSMLQYINYNAKMVPSYAFSGFGNTLRVIVLGKNVTNINENAFSNCKGLQQIFIPKSVTEIEKAAFKDCTSLVSVEYSGNEADWEEIYIGSGNENLKNADFHYNIYVSDATYIVYVVNDDNTITITDCNIISTTNINIPNEIDGMPVTSISAGAFANRSDVTSITIPDSVTTIGEKAFNGCSSLTNIVIPDGVTAIEKDTFENCTGLKSITMPKSVTSIGQYAFHNCDSLKNINYTGSEEEWNAIDIGFGNDSLNNADKNYSFEPIVITQAQVNKSDTGIAWTFDVTVEKVYKNSFVYVALYDSDNVLLSVKKSALDDTTVNVTVNKTDNAAYAKVFVWDNQMQPVIFAERIEL